MSSKIAKKIKASVNEKKKDLRVGMSTGYPGPGISREIPGLRNPGILVPEKSRDKKSRD